MRSIIQIILISTIHIINVKSIQLFSFRQSSVSSNTITIKKQKSTNPIIGVGPFLGDDRYNECNIHLQMSNTNGKLYQNDYASFISLYSYGYINATSFTDLKNYNLAYINLFYSYSCNPKCTEEEFVEDNFVFGALKSSSNAIKILEKYEKGVKNCCEDNGDLPYIEIDHASIDSLFYICAYADEYIREDIKDMISDVPSFTPTVVASSIPTIMNSSMPTLSPSVIPSIMNSSAPSLDPTSFPTITPTSQPTFNPTSKPTPRPTFNPTYHPTMPPTDSPTASPTLAPTTSNPSDMPTSIPTDIPTSPPTNIPTIVSSNKPSIALSDIPSIQPTSSPTITPTTTNPTVTPSDTPTNTPTSNPTSTPTITPTSSNPTSTPSDTPTNTPTNIPTSSFEPTAFGKHRTKFAYRMTVLGFDANDISTGDNNTIQDDLITATTIVVKRVLKNDDPCIPLKNENKNSNRRILRNDHKYIHNNNNDGKNRKLAEYREYAPVEILSVIDVDCQGLALIQKGRNSDTNCILIRSAVTIYCTDPEEDCEQIQEDVINGIRDSIENGCFFEALPMQ